MTHTAYDTPQAAAANGQGSMPGELIAELVTAAPLDGIAEFVAVRCVLADATP